MKNSALITLSLFLGLFSLCTYAAPLPVEYFAKQAQLPPLNYRQTANI
ncbi:MAG: hypothetical protein MJK04_17435 [Psychrosphaera sp.]|nr:hypothetical protein [Psychrosphaera sp.]